MTTKLDFAEYTKYRHYVCLLCAKGYTQTHTVTDGLFHTPYDPPQNHIKKPCAALDYKDWITIVHNRALRERNEAYRIIAMWLPSIKTMAAMDRPNSNLGELVCQRGIASDMTVLFNRDFRKAKDALDYYSRLYRSSNFPQRPTLEEELQNFKNTDYSGHFGLGHIDQKERIYDVCNFIDDGVFLNSVLAGYRPIPNNELEILRQNIGHLKTQLDSLQKKTGK